MLFTRRVDWYERSLWKFVRHDLLFDYDQLAAEWKKQKMILENLFSFVFTLYLQKINKFRVKQLFKH